MNPVAYLVKNCPDFHFLPAYRYDRVFVVPAQQEHMERLAVGDIERIPLYPCPEDEAEFWVINDTYAAYDLESAESARHLGMTAMPVSSLKVGDGDLAQLVRARLNTLVQDLTEADTAKRIRYQCEKCVCVRLKLQPCIIEFSQPGAQVPPKFCPWYREYADWELMD